MSNIGRQFRQEQGPGEKAVTKRPPANDLTGHTVGNGAPLSRETAVLRARVEALEIEKKGWKERALRAEKENEFLSKERDQLILEGMHPAQPGPSELDQTSAVPRTLNAAPVVGERKTPGRPRLPISEAERQTRKRALAKARKVRHAAKKAPE